MIPLLFTLALAAAPDTAQDPVLRAMTDELARTKSLKLPDSPAPYFASTTVVDVDQVVVAASLGALVDSTTNENRIVSPMVRVGDFQVDAIGFPMTFEPPLVAYEDDYDALRKVLWLLTDSAYKNAALGHRHRKNERQQTTADPDEADAFTPHTGTVALAAGATPSLDRARFEALAKQGSAVFREFEHIQSGTVEVLASTTLRRMVSSDGDAISGRAQLVRIQIRARAQAQDGEMLGHSAMLFGELDEFDDAEVIAAARKVAEELTALRSAPVIEDYAGPVLYEGEAAGRWLSDSLVPHLSAGLRWGPEFENRMGQLVLPRGVSIVDDPQRSEQGGQRLVGTMKIDDEGEEAQRVELVKDGKLVGLLASRTPSKKVKTSNGHARAGLPGMPPQAGITNLIVQSSKGLSDAALEKKLLELVRKRGAEFGLIVRATEGAHRPSVAVRVGKDGKKELVRVGFVQNVEPRTLREIVALGKTPVASHHLLVGGNPTGWHLPAEYAPFAAPASIVAPSILVGELEMHRGKGGNPKPPAYPKPPMPAKR